jgi:hypothetical protein
MFVIIVAMYWHSWQLFSARSPSQHRQLVLMTMTQMIFSTLDTASFSRMKKRIMVMTWMKNNEVLVLRVPSVATNDVCHRQAYQICHTNLPRFASRRVRNPRLATLILLFKVLFERLMLITAPI